MLHWNDCSESCVHTGCVCHHFVCCLACICSSIAVRRDTQLQCRSMTSALCRAITTLSIDRSVRVCEWESELKLHGVVICISPACEDDDDDERAGSGSADHTPSTPLTARMDSSNLEGQARPGPSTAYYYAYMGVLCRFPCCLFDLACFFLPFFSSLNKTRIIIAQGFSSFHP